VAQSVAQSVRFSIQIGRILRRFRCDLNLRAYWDAPLAGSIDGQMRRDAPEKRHTIGPVSPRQRVPRYPGRRCEPTAPDAPL